MLAGAMTGDVDTNATAVLDAHARRCLDEVQKADQEYSALLASHADAQVCVSYTPNGLSCPCIWVHGWDNILS